MFDSWDQLLSEYGMTEEETDELFRRPWPGQRNEHGALHGYCPCGEPLMPEEIPDGLCDACFREDNDGQETE